MLMTNWAEDFPILIFHVFSSQGFGMISLTQIFRLTGGHHAKKEPPFKPIN